MPYLTEEEYKELEKELAWYKSLHATTMTRTWDEVAFELRTKNTEICEVLEEAVKIIKYFYEKFPDNAERDFSVHVFLERATAALNQSALTRKDEA